MKNLITALFAAVMLSGPFNSAYADNAEYSNVHSLYNRMYCWLTPCKTQQDFRARDDVWQKFVLPLAQVLQAPSPSLQGGNQTVEKVPELDGSAAPVAAALILGLAGLGIERRRRQRTKAKA